MIGDPTKHVVCYKNCLKACRVCQRHAKNRDKNKTPDLPVCCHACPLKGVESVAALECMNKMWTPSEIAAFNNHCPRCPKYAQTNKPRRGTKKLQKRQQGETTKIPSTNQFSCRMVPPGTHVWEVPVGLEEKGGKQQSEINVVDCLHLKQNYTWWLFLGWNLTYTQFQQSAKSPVLHHFNDHSASGPGAKSSR
jgi:hypothetical protein